MNFDHENQDLFSYEHDQQLLLWQNSHPEDWLSSWTTEVVRKKIHTYI